MSTERIAIYPGSFDPITNGHIDILLRSLKMFDRVVVAIADNVRKKPLFSVEERREQILQAVNHDPRVDVDAFSGLLVTYVKDRGARFVVRGLRALADFEYEFQMALMNRHLNPRIETVFMMPKEEYSYVSSRLLKEVSRFGAEVDGPPPGVQTDGAGAPSGAPDGAAGGPHSLRQLSAEGRAAPAPQAAHRTAAHRPRRRWRGMAAAALSKRSGYHDHMDLGSLVKLFHAAHFCNTRSAPHGYGHVRHEKAQCRGNFSAARYPDRYVSMHHAHHPQVLRSLHLEQIHPVAKPVHGEAEPPLALA